MKVLSKQDYDILKSGAEVTAADAHGEKVLHLADGSYLKLFRVKRLITSARLFPYWRRFIDNAEKLQQLGVPTLKVVDVFQLPELKRTAVHYLPLPGDTIRELGSLDETLAGQIGQFISDLHDKGVYHRSMHLGNVVLSPQGELGLIDIADMRIHGRPLSETKRRRNLKHLARYEQDRAALEMHLAEFVGAFDERLKPAAIRMFSHSIT